MTQNGQQVKKLLETEDNTWLYKFNFPMKTATKHCEKNFKGRAVEKEMNSGTYNNGDKLK